MPTLLACICLALLPQWAWAETVEGMFAFHNQLRILDIAYQDTTVPLRAWTDSYQDGQNFDPVLSLWDASGNLVAISDDVEPETGAFIDPANQTEFDAGFSLNLPAGSYRLILSVFDNFPVNLDTDTFPPNLAGILLADGFFYDAATPVAIEDWDDGEVAPGEGAQGFYRIRLENAAVVPLPGAAWLLLAGLGGALGARRRLA